MPENNEPPNENSKTKNRNSKDFPIEKINSCLFSLGKLINAKGPIRMSIKKYFFSGKMMALDACIVIILTFTPCHSRSLRLTQAVTQTVIISVIRMKPS
jgi:hypothetical protein